MRFRDRSLCLLVLLGAAIASAAGEHWKVLLMDGGIRLEYPDYWRPVVVAKASLHIRSNKGPAAEAALPTDQAEILVTMEVQSGDASFERLIARSVQHQTVLLTEELPATAPHGCTHLTKVVSLEERDTTAELSDTRIFCDTGLTSVVVLLRSRQGDARQVQYQAVALRMAKSILRTQ